jgi:hypothetical protein
MDRDDLFDPLPSHVAEEIENSWEYEQVRRRQLEKVEYEREEPWVMLAGAMIACTIVGICAAVVLVAVFS